MPNQRGPGQKLIAITMDEKFIDFIDESLRALRYPDRSTFIRQAISEKLASDGYKIPHGLDAAPYRAGKSAKDRLELNDANLDDLDQDALAVVKAIEKKVDAKLASEQKPVTASPSYPTVSPPPISYWRTKGRRASQKG